MEYMSDGQQRFGCTEIPWKSLCNMRELKQTLLLLSNYFFLLSCMKVMESHFRPWLGEAIVFTSNITALPHTALGMIVSEIIKNENGHTLKPGSVSLYIFRYKYTYKWQLCFSH